MLLLCVSVVVISYLQCVQANNKIEERIDFERRKAMLELSKLSICQIEEAIETLTVGDVFPEGISDEFLLKDGAKGTHIYTYRSTNKRLVNLLRWLKRIDDKAYKSLIGLKEKATVSSGIKSKEIAEDIKSISQVSNLELFFNGVKGFVVSLVPDSPLQLGPGNLLKAGMGKVMYEASAVAAEEMQTGDSGKIDSCKKGLEIERAAATETNQPAVNGGEMQGDIGDKSNSIWMMCSECYSSISQTVAGWTGFDYTLEAAAVLTAAFAIAITKYCCCKKSKGKKHKVQKVSGVYKIANRLQFA